MTILNFNAMHIRATQRAALVGVQLSVLATLKRSVSAKEAIAP